MRFETNSNYQLVSKWMAAVMSLAYIALGLALLLSIGRLGEMSGTQRMLLGGMMLCYGLFRGVRFVTKYLIKKKEDDDRE